MGSALAANLVATGHDVVAYDVSGPGAMSRRGPVRRRRGPAWPPARGSSCSACPTVRCPSRSPMRSLRSTDWRTTHVVDTSTVGVAGARSIDTLLADAGIVLRRRPGVRRRGRGPGPHADRHVRRTGRRLRGGRAGAGRPERPPPPGRRPAGHGPGAQAGQQLPVGHGAGRDQRGRRLRPVGRARHGHHARGAERLERPERGHHATSSPTTC